MGCVIQVEKWLKNTGAQCCSSNCNLKQVYTAVKILLLNVLEGYALKFKYACITNLLRESPFSHDLIKTQLILFAVFWHNYNYYYLY